MYFIFLSYNNLISIPYILIKLSPAIYVNFSKTCSKILYILASYTTKTYYLP